ncbi:hypothetical protein EI94DRAFT_1721860 [Lactarius quietus]|nr:hypothetical protein EI94DRAFT_1721860 [Lactarius quietus]
MNLGQGNSRERLQQAIDAEINSLEETVRALKLRRNALSPISSLPHDVFTTIFLILCIPASGTSSLDGKSNYHLTRVRVTHVCHQWREMALNQPLLWSHVDFTSLSLAGVAETLVRAKSVPLYLEANVFGHRWDDVRISAFREELQARVYHIRHLRTSAEPDHLNSTLEGLVSPAPTLEYLSLSSHGRHQSPRRLFIPHTLFGGSAPRLSRLELCNCIISWKSPLLRGLKYLEILTPPADRPNLAVWLDALDAMPHLKTLTLHSASPIALPLPFDADRTVTLPFLTRLDVSASPGDCALALAHLDLPALTWLCLTAISSRLQGIADIQSLLPYVARHAHGPQDTQPLQSVFIRSDRHHADILAWPVPNIDDAVHDPPTLLAATLPTRVALSFRSDDLEWFSAERRLEILDTVMAGLPLNGLVTLAAHDLSNRQSEADLDTQHFWLYLSPKWPLLQSVRLAPPAAYGFMEILLEDNGGRERALLPSLTELVVVDYTLFELKLAPLCDALMKRVEQGVPVQMLDLRMCTTHPDDGAEDWLRSLSEIGVDVLGPEKTLETREQMESMWRTVTCELFVDDDNFQRR